MEISLKELAEVLSDKTYSQQTYTRQRYRRLHCPTAVEVQSLEYGVYWISGKRQEGESLG